MGVALKSFLVFITFLLAAATGACSQNSETQGQKPDYKEMKQMVIDILQTEDGKKAIADVLSDPKLKRQIIIDESSMKATMEKTFADPKNAKAFTDMMKDPKFAAALGKTLSEENKKLMKDLMKDPEYQRMMVGVMKDPEFEKHLLDVMKSSAYRQQMMTVMKESLQSPMFRLELMELMMKAQQEATKPEKSGKGPGGGGQQGGSG